MRHASAAGAALLVLMTHAPAAAQTLPSEPAPPAVGFSFSDAAIRDLPLGGSVYALLETTQPEVIADRFNNGGLNTGGPARVGGFLGSWSQTLFRIGDLNVSDPGGSGASLLFPETLFWRQVRVDTGLMPNDVNTPGLAVTLEPRRAATSWTRTLFGAGSGGGLAAGAPDNQPPPITRLRSYGTGSALISGPLTDRVGLVAAGTWSGGDALDRERVLSTRSTLASGFAHVVFEPSPTHEWRALAWVQRAEGPFREWQAFQNSSAATRDTSIHVQSTWEQRPPDATRWRVFGGFTQRLRENVLGASSILAERIVAGPVPSILDAAAGGSTRRASGGLRIAPRVRLDARHHFDFGVDLDHASATVTDPFTGTARELVNGLPARLWTVTAGTGASDRRTTSIAGYASDAVTLSPTVSVEMSLRAELIHGRAQGAAGAIDWRSVLPSARLRWLFAERHRIALIAGYARTANALNLNWLAYGDPAAPIASIAAADAPATVVARVGPGTGGNPGFSGIDSRLARPYTDEFVVGLESRRGASTRYTLTGIARREANLLGVVDVGVPASGYSTIGVPDAGKDLTDPVDDRTLLVFNRLPSTFGRDAYLLTNPGQKAATVFALKLTAERSVERLFVLFGATASAAQGSAGNRGYGPLENDQDVPGELLINPNAATYAGGRLFSDRAFTIKWTTLYRFPRNFTIGAIARYQDGQPFSRLVVVSGLNQGTEAVQSYPNGGSRFTFTGTLDLRIQKGFSAGAARIDVVLDAYDLFTRSNEVDEYVVSGPFFRTPTAIEPPRNVHLGLRVTF